MKAITAPLLFLLGFALGAWLIPIIRLHLFGVRCDAGVEGAPDTDRSPTAPEWSEVSEYE